MKTQKRDSSIRAYKKGYQAGLCGKSKDSCPVSQYPGKQEWLTGWREGRKDNWDGLTGVSGISKMAEVIH